MHDKITNFGFTLDHVWLAPRGGAPGELSPAHDAYFDTHYLMFPADNREEFTRREFDSISADLRKVLAKHNEVIDHHFIEGQSSALLHLVLKVKPRK